MDPIDPALDRSRLRTRLRRARDAAGLTQAAVAAELDWSVSKVNRIESGQSAISKADVRRLMTLYGASESDAEIDELVELARRSRHQTWSRYRDVLNADYVQYLGYEDSASKVFSFHGAVFPAALQSERYATDLIRSMSDGVPEEVTARRIKARIARRKFVEQAEENSVTFVLGESVIWNWVGFPGNPATMRDQLWHVMGLSQTTAVNIQVLPSTAGSHLGLGGPYVILTYADGHPDVLYRELNRPAIIVGDAKGIKPYQESFNRILAVSKPIGEFVGPALDALDRHGIPR